MYYAVDKRGRGFLFKDKPERHFDCTWFDSINQERKDERERIEITDRPFLRINLPTLKWKDEPIEVVIIEK